MESIRKYFIPSLRIPLIWCGIIIIVGAFAILIHEPIQVAKWHWVIIGNYLLSLAVATPGAIF